jgi:hypothetical protein
MPALRATSRSIIDRLPAASARSKRVPTSIDWIPCRCLVGSVLMVSDIGLLQGSGQRLQRGGVVGFVLDFGNQLAVQHVVVGIEN